MESISMTDPMNRTCSAVIQLASMVCKKCHDDGDDDVMVYRINWLLMELER